MPKKTEPVPEFVSQAYFWTPEWQTKDKAVDGDKRKGKVKFFRSAEELIRELRSSR